MMGDLFDFFKYLIKDAFKEFVEVLKDIISLRPKTMVALTGILFIISWLLGYKGISISLVVIYTGFLFYKYYIAGDWRRQAKEDKMKKARGATKGEGLDQNQGTQQ